MSIDALRGFDMLWIVGAGSLVNALNRMTQTGPTKFLATQLEHAEWEGFRFYDLIFPLFVFISGVSMVFSLGKTIQQQGRAEALKRVVRRGVLLFLLGLFYYRGFSEPWPNMRLMGVLNRIALAYLFAGLLFCLVNTRALLAICIGLLTGYWLLLAAVPIRDVQLTPENIARLATQAGDAETAAYFANKSSPNASTFRNNSAWAGAQKLFYGTTQRVAGKFSPGYNLVNHIDFEFLPGKKWDVFYDPEGLLSTLPAIATCLLGVFAGLLLKNPIVSDQRKVLYLLGFGAGAVVLGWIWHLQFPVIKKLWTSSYVLVAGGYSAILLGVFYWIIDVSQIRGWSQPFVWIGMNSITIYLASNLIDGGFNKMAQRLAGGDVKAFFDAHLAQGMGDLIVAIVGLLLVFWFMNYLYRRKVFLRL